MRDPAPARIPFAANVPRSFSRPPFSLSLSTHPPHANFPFCQLARARAARVSLSALGGTFLRFSSASRARSTRFVLPFVSRALCFFLFSPTPDAANCALLDEILLPPAVAAASPPPPPSPPPLRCAAARLPLPIHLPRKRRDRTTRPLYLPEREIDKKRERDEFFIFASSFYYYGTADDYFTVADIVSNEAACKSVLSTGKLRKGNKKERVSQIIAFVDFISESWLGNQD